MHLIAGNMYRNPKTQNLRTHLCLWILRFWIFYGVRYFLKKIQDSWNNWGRQISASEAGNLPELVKICVHFQNALVIQWVLVFDSSIFKMDDVSAAFGN